MRDLFKELLNRKGTFWKHLPFGGDPFEKIFYGRLLLVHKNLFEANRAIAMHCGVSTVD